MKISKRLKITGKVQGVSYRESMRLECLRLGVTGWVRNRIDGSVEAIVQGEELLVNEIIRWCYIGPPTAIVKNIEIFEASNEPALSQFQREKTK